VDFTDWLKESPDGIRSQYGDQKGSNDEDGKDRNPDPLIVLGVTSIALLGIAGLSFLREDIRILIFSLLALPFYSKLELDEVLDQTNRQDIFSFIAHNPGSNLTKIHRSLPIGYGTLVHHLKILERERHIRSKKDNSRRIFYPKNMDWKTSAPDEGGNLSSVPVKLQITSYLKDHGPATKKMIEEALGASQQSVSYAIKKLEEEGTVMGSGEKRGAKYRIN